MYLHPSSNRVFNGSINNCGDINVFNVIDSVKTNSYQESLHNTTKYGEVSNYKHALAFLFGNLHVLMG